MKGKISQWHDDKGFGFIVSDDGAEKVFFHISSLKNSSRRPLVGDSVIYESALDAKQRLQAKAVLIEGLAVQATPYRTSQLIQITPCQKNALDYLLILIFMGCLVKVGLDYHHVRLLNEEMVPYAIGLVIAFLVLKRQKKPKEKQFSCARCKAVANFDPRTIQAWNKGFLKLYCDPCHQRWLRENPVQPIRSYVVGRGSGCMVLLCVFTLAPILMAIALYQWMMT